MSTLFLQTHGGSVRGLCGLLLSALAAAGCQKAQLLAPTNSTIQVTAASRVLPLNGTTEVTATVLESSGTAVQNGTTVRFTTTLGNVNPTEVQTRNGIATTTFSAGGSSGVADVKATSGAASGGTGTTATNVVQITIGAAAVNTVTLRANPGNVGPAGGRVELIATVVAENGRVLPGLEVTFNTDQGTLGSARVTTDTAGEARTTLTTSQKASVTATAGTKTSTAVTVDLRVGPGVTITCAPASGTGNCAAVQASVASNTATVVFTVAKVSSTSNLSTATIDFGDNTSRSLGNLSGTATITHSYDGPSGTSPRSYTVTVQATDINGETASATSTVIITPRAMLTPISVTLAATSETGTLQGQRWTFTATVTGGGEGTGNTPIQSYTWNFGDDTAEVTTSGNSTTHIYTADGRRTVTVTVKAQDGRTAGARVEIIVDVL